MTTLPRIATITALAAMMLPIIPLPARAAESADSIYTRALARERELRDDATAADLRAVVRIYESVVRLYPRSGYCDNALWQAANLSLLSAERFGEALDKRTAIRLFTHLRTQYPTSPLAGRAAEALQRLDTAGAQPAAPVPAAPAIADTSSRVDASNPGHDGTVAAPSIAQIREIKRTPLPDGVRVTIELDAESLYRSERLDNPRRVFFDLKGARALPPLQDATLRFTDDIVREIRLGRHPQNTTRVVMDLESVENYSVFTLYNPFRVMIDFQRAAPASTTMTKPNLPVASGVSTPAPGAPAAVAPPRALLSTEEKPISASREPVPLLSRPAGAPVSPAAPIANSNGQFSLARQLGLGISRIVLDAGHGGHDPGARANGINEAELVLDVTLRLRDLLEKQPGIEVCLTRSTDEFIPLEERTAIANRQNADLFLSIHANASRNPRARGIETYFLNFASNPEAEAVAARENSASGKTMHSLPEIVRAIALNNKIDESRDFAEMVQKAMVRRLSTRNAQPRDLGVKQAPFVVLIGAGMPSVLAEIAFVTNKQDGALLKTSAYRQQIAESLLDAILRYQRSLKGTRAVAVKE
jgi:N-acetylmuramoyl-L-alanine amidase